MEITRNGFVRFLSALMSAIFVFTFLPFNAVGVYAEGEKGFNHDNAFTVVVYEKLGESHKEDRSFGTYDNYGNAVVNTIDVYNNVVEGAYVTLTCLTDEGVKFDGTTDSQGKVKFDLAKSYFEPKGFPDHPFRLEVTKADTGYVSFSEIIHPNGTFDGAYFYYPVALELTDLSQGNVEKSIVYDGIDHKASEFSDLSGNGLNVDYYVNGEVVTEPSFKDVGTYEFTAVFSGEGYYAFENDTDSYAVDYSITIKPIERDDFAFADDNSEIELNYVKDNTTFTNVASCSKDPKPSNIIYSSSDPDTATVDTSGTVTFLKAGTVIIEATAPAIGFYEEKTIEYSISALQEFTAVFANATVEGYYGKTLNDETGKALALNKLSFLYYQPDKVTIKYSIIENGHLAEINRNTGVITPKGIGSVTVQATISAPNCKTTTASYKLNINKGKVRDDLQLNSYSEYEFDKEYAIFKDNYSDFSFVPVSGGDLFDIKDGKIKILGVSSEQFEVDITVPENDLYEEYTYHIKGNTVKAQHTLEFANKPFTDYANKKTYYIKLTGDCFTSTSVECTAPGATVDFGYYGGNQYLVLSFKEYVISSISFTVTITCNKDDTYDEKVITCNGLIGFDSSISTEIYYNNETNVKNWYTEDVIVRPKNPQLFIETPEGERVPSYTIPDNGVHPAYSTYFYQSKVEGEGNINLGSVQEIKIDKEFPSVSIDISSSSPDSAKPGTYKDGEKCIFANSALLVTVSALDSVSGFGHIEYDYGEGTKTEVDYGGSDVYGLTDEVVGTFTIPANNFGKLKIWVYDIAGNCTATYDDNEEPQMSNLISLNGESLGLSAEQDLLIMTDDVKPRLFVEFYNNDDQHDLYFSADRSATIYIDEANYNSKAVVLTVEKDGVSILDNINIVFDDQHKQIKIPFEGDGDYSFDVKYTDYCGNEGEVTYIKDHSAAHDHFIIDTTKPIVSVSFDNNEAANDKYFNNNRTATINITEKNYLYEDLTIDVSIVSGTSSRFAELDKDIKIERDDENEESRTVTVEFLVDGEYVFNVYYQDRALNDANVFFLGASWNNFVIDTKAPVVNVSYSNNTVYNEKFFNNERIATFTVEEHNFDENNAVLIINNVVVPLEWSPDADVHTADYTFGQVKDEEFTISFTCTDMALNDCESVNYGTSAAPTNFVVDKTPPVNLTMTIDGESIQGDNLIPSEDKSAVVTNSITFDRFYNEPVTVFLGADCSISGLSALQYQLADKSSEYGITDTWLDYDETTGITINPGHKFVLYFRATDMASNSTTINSAGIIIDSTEPEGEKNAPEIDIIPAAPNSNGFYNGDVSVKLTATDPAFLGDTRDADGSYSGLKRITYKIYATDTGAEEKGTLLNLSVDEDNPKIIGKEDASVDRYALAHSWTKNITIDSEKFNSNNVIVEVMAEDNAGNIRITKTNPGAIKIDITNPSIVISYNNNNADSDNCFKDDRVATITITERNFDPKDVNVTLTSSTGTKPEVNGWTKTVGSGNGDNTKWTTTIPYTRDADYTFDIAYTDPANNVAKSIDFGNSVAPKAFTIDKTVPTVNVSYDNNVVANNIYYNKNRNATITIVEHNFDAGRVNITLKATDDGAIINVPAVSNWTNNGDTHTATIAYDKDGKYVFDISVKDKAGNDAADFAEQTFFIDTKAPELKITGVKDKSANNGDISLDFTYSDTNYSEQFVYVNFSGANRGKLVLDGTYTDIHNGKSFKFNEFAKQKDIDDIYTLEVTIIDLAGNESSQLLTFSINRFGSTYELGDAAKTINGTYVQKPVDIVISEVNPNQLVESVVTIFKNNESITLVEGVDYDVQRTGGNGEWCGYQYTIHSDKFADDGVYKVSVYSRDEAGNISENTLDTKNTSLQFGIDATSPNIVAANLSGNTTYAEESHKVSLIVTDNLLLSGVDVYLDDYNTPYVSWTAEQVAEILTGNGSFTFDITDYSNSAHKVKIVGTDAAGNVSELEITNFYVTTNLFVRYYTNTPLVIGSIVGLFLIVALAVVIVVVKRRKYSKR
ncbi:Ig-like domain-containing protein [Butyrivibrio sp. AE2032]|uniref:Ig-like domain-containing protein n=1 Tax=Butyrivibrio sp. AE2032 TaxID=1458463 RepID=UPI000553AAF2|nr:Ig-like domain-containing protein [Butyrivibrio sp. AE2032]